MKPCNTQKHNLDRALLGSSYLLYMCAVCVYMHVPGSQAPRLQNVNTEGVESLVFFCNVKSAKGRERVARETLIVRGRTQRLRTGKRVKVAGYLLHVSCYWGANIINPKRSTHGWLNNLENVAFQFQKLWSYFDYIMVM